MVQQLCFMAEGGGGAPPEPASWGWTFPDAGTSCKTLIRYQSYENPEETLLVACVCLTNDVNQTSMKHAGRRLVTVTEQGNPCSGRVAGWVETVDNSANYMKLYTEF